MISGRQKLLLLGKGKRNEKGSWLVLLFVIVGFAQSFSASCPYDGEIASMTHTEGFGQQRVCW
jgi:hypothetical protein